jgi:hypothetical protein
MPIVFKEKKEIKKKRKREGGDGRWGGGDPLSQAGPRRSHPHPHPFVMVEPPPASTGWRVHLRAVDLHPLLFFSF